ncbi:dTDP-6-deoxy-D-glucose-3,5-epimerase [Serratia nevei]|uniref:dTDP-6-deoxy-D-glucose-3,5-epimerase n=1 Tax=Serratia nevei TaxID=2703794 RepID=UPI00313C6195
MTLTTETLNDFIAGRGFGVAPSAVEAMARELLANREAQPVGYIDPDSLKEYRGQRAGGTWSAVQRTTSGLNMTTPIYTAPPAPVVPQEISSAIRHLKDALVACNRFNYCADAVNRVEDACRAAMLTAVPEGGNDHDTRR